MYYIQNGKKVAGNLSVGAPIKLNAASTPSTTQKTSGGNKEVLYASLVLGFIILLLAIYLLYRHFAMKKPEKFG